MNNYHNYWKLTVAATTACVAANIALAKIEVSTIFSSDMVLQRGKPVPVWGMADPNETVNVEFAGQQLETKADAKGKWSVKLAPLEVSKEGRELKIGDKVFKNVVVGDVWLVSGQSNAEMPFGWGVLKGNETKAAAKDYPNIRQIKVKHAISTIPLTYQFCNQTPWRVCTADVLNNVTAMGYFFALEINAKTGVPIGLVDDNWSGCNIEPFICREGWAAVPGNEKTLAIIDERINRYKSDMDAFIAKWQAGDFEAQPAQFGNGEAHQHNAMIEPIVRFPIAGALWYQGCSNGGEGMSYAKKLEALVTGWRSKWGYDFPFYIVQLSTLHNKTTDPAGGNGYAKIRNAMRIAAQTIPNCGLAVTFDIGNPKDIHPKNKQDVGIRLSKWALRDVYGDKSVVVSGPLYTGMKVEGSAIRLSFDYAEGMFAGEKAPDSCGELPTPTKDGVIKGFAIAGADKKWQWATAKVDGKDIIVSSDKVAEPVAVRYGFRANPMGDSNLYNAAGLPASPFRTDDW